MGDLSSAPVAPVGPADHVRGPDGAPEIIVYGDYECPFCAALELQLGEVAVRVAFRHFPVRGSHPRAYAAACAAEAAGRQDAFWPMHDALFADQGRLEDPHLWTRAERLGLDLVRFDADRRDPPIAERVTADPLHRRRAPSRPSGFRCLGAAGEPRRVIARIPARCPLTSLGQWPRDRPAAPTGHRGHGARRSPAHG